MSVSFRLQAGGGAKTSLKHARVCGWDLRGYPVA